MVNKAGKCRTSKQDEYEGREPLKAEILFQPWERVPFQLPKLVSLTNSLDSP